MNARRARLISSFFLRFLLVLCIWVILEYWNSWRSITCRFCVDGAFDCPRTRSYFRWKSSLFSLKNHTFFCAHTAKLNTYFLNCRRRNTSTNTHTHTHRACNLHFCPMVYQHVLYIYYNARFMPPNIRFWLNKFVPRRPGGNKTGIVFKHE